MTRPDPTNVMQGLVLGLYLLLMAVMAWGLPGCTGYVSRRAEYVAPERVFTAVVDGWHTRVGFEAPAREWVFSVLDREEIAVVYGGDGTSHLAVSHGMPGPCLVYVADDLAPVERCRAAVDEFTRCLEHAARMDLAGEPLAWERLWGTGGVAALAGMVCE